MADALERETLSLRGEAPVYWQSIFFSLLINVLSLALPIAMLQVYDRILANQATGTAFLLVSGVAAAILLEGFLRFGRGLLGALYSENFDHRAPVEVMGRLLTSDIKAVEESGRGKLLNYFHSLATLRHHFAGQSVQVLCDLPFAFLFIAAIAYIGGKLVLVPAALLLLAIVFGAIFGAMIRKPIIQQEEGIIGRDRFLLRCLNSLNTIKGRALEPVLATRFEGMTGNIAQSTLEIDRVSAAVQNAIMALSQLGTVGIVMYGSYLVIVGEITTGMLAACTTLTGRAIAPVGGLVSYWTRYQKSLEAQKHLKDVFNLPVDRVFRAATAEPTPSIESGDIEVSAVNIRHPWGTLHNVDLSVQSGEIIALEGPPRSGKSTLLSAVAGVYPPDSGTITIDGRPLASYTRDRFLDGLCYVPRRSSVFRGTVMENLTMYQTQLGAGALDYARKLGLNGYVESLPQGYDTPMSWAMDGPMSEPGMIQRIGIVRALTREPKILVLDDADVPIDLDGLKRLCEVLNSLRGATTVLMVSHRDAVKEVADRRITMNNGQIQSVRVRTQPAGGR